MAEAKWSGVLSTTEPRNDVGIIKVRQGNINSEIAEFQIVQNNKPYDLTGLTVYFCASFGLNLVEKPAVVINTTGGKIQYTFDDDSMQAVGRQKGYFSIKKAESKIDSTQEFEYQVESSLMTRSIDGKSYIYKLSTLIKVLDDFIKNGQNNFNVWFESVKEILYGVDPGGNILRELIEARKNSSGNIFASLKARLDKNEDDTAAQFAQTNSYFHKTVHANDFLTDENTIEDAIEEAFAYGAEFVISQPEANGSYINSNVTIKVLPGRYYITREVKVLQKGFNLDFTECLFVASPSNKTVDFINALATSWRNRYIGGNFVGFKDVFKVSTNNADSARLIFENPTFQQCHTGIDTSSIAESRSTYLEVNELYSIDTDRMLVAHTDMAVINGGWVTHSGYNGAVVINYANLKINDVVFVPYPALDDTFETRWIDNYSQESHAGERSLTLKHCRFGGEEGAMPIVYNYAKAYYFNRWQTRIIVDDCSVASNRGCFVFHEMPNFVKITNSTGFIDTHVFRAINETIVNEASEELVTIEIDRSVRNALDLGYDLFNYESLYRFLNVPVSDTKRYASNFYKAKVHIPKEILNSSSFQIPVSLPKAYGEAGFTDSFNISFLLNVSGQLNSSSDAYRTNSLFYVTITGGIGQGFGGAAYRVNYTALGTHAGGVDDLDKIAISAVKINDSSDNTIGVSNIKELLLKFTFTKEIKTGQYNITPLSGSGHIQYK